MRLDHDTCLRAVRSRDPRFDGLFFTGVTSTGIYCRPVCPARTPRAENCVFYPSAAAAAAAGLRPCLRCRPETSPGSPAWRGADAVVGRALRLIEEGALDRGSAAELASRLGVGDRHLRRLFAERLGASPRAVAMARRLDLARRLLVETGWKVGRIAPTVGFGSVRRFHAAAARAWGMPPSALRARRAVGAKAMPGGGLELRLALRPPFSWADLVAWLRPRAVAGVETVTDVSYARTARLDGAAGRWEVTPDPRGDALRLRVSGSLAPQLRRVVARVRAMFDLDADPRAVGEALSVDPTLAPLVARRPGLRLPGAWDPFEVAVRAVLGQQVSVAAATTLAGRVAAAFGPRTDAAGGGGLAFPGPEDLVEAPLEKCGVVRARADTVRRLARAVLDGTLRLDPAADPERVASDLLRLRGVGPWTAQYVALRGLGDPDVFPAGDLGLRRVFAADGDAPTESVLRRRAEAWRPWRSYAAVHLWASLSDPKRGEAR